MGHIGSVKFGFSESYLYPTVLSEATQTRRVHTS